jgi:hypothetical protein
VVNWEPAPRNSDGDANGVVALCGDFADQFQRRKYQIACAIKAGLSRWQRYVKTELWSFNKDFS